MITTLNLPPKQFTLTKMTKRPVSSLTLSNKIGMSINEVEHILQTLIKDKLIVKVPSKSCGTYGPDYLYKLS